MLSALAETLENLVYSVLSTWEKVVRYINQVKLVILLTLLLPLPFYFCLSAYVVYARAGQTMTVTLSTGINPEDGRAEFTVSHLGIFLQVKRLISALRRWWRKLDRKDTGNRWLLYIHRCPPGCWLQATDFCWMKISLSKVRIRQSADLKAVFWQFSNPSNLLPYRFDCTLRDKKFIVSSMIPQGHSVLVSLIRY